MGSYLPQTGHPCRSLRCIDTLFAFLRCLGAGDQVDLGDVTGDAPSVQRPCDDAEREQPVPMRGGAGHADLPADHFPGIAVGPQPDNPGIDRIEMAQPGQWSWPCTMLS